MVMKWILYCLGGLAAIVVILIFVAQMYVGGVNVPLGEGKVDADLLARRIVLPAGFDFAVYYADIANARIIRFTDGGELLVANPNLGRIMVLQRDDDGDGQADGKRLLIDGLNGPNGLDFYKEWLYIAETDAIGRVPFDHQSGTLTGEYERIVTDLPGGGNHWKKTLLFGPDGLIYVTFGSSCNVCDEQDKRRAAMLRYRPDGSGEEILATGLRNSAGFDWSPLDGQIYATDNGRDMLGDDYPPCELNKIEPGKFYGWPYANGNNDPDPDMGEGKERDIAAATPIIHGVRAHTAPLGIIFLRSRQLPEEYRGAALVALHGSWNRSEKDGYEVVSLHWDEAGQIEERPFMTGFLLDDEAIGRPAELTEGPDGSIYVADDYAGAIYRVSHRD